MAWVAALVIVLLIALPAGFWWLSRRPGVTARFSRLGYGKDDRWLADEYGLDWHQRSRVQRAVASGVVVTDPVLEPAARGLAERILSGSSRAIAVWRVTGWLDLFVACLFAGIGIYFLVSGQSVAVVPISLAFSLLYGLLFRSRAIVHTRRMRDNARRALQGASPDG